MTNLALALRQEPALPTLLRRLVIMGGAYDYRGNTNPVAEWNVAFDPEAAAEGSRCLVPRRVGRSMNNSNFRSCAA